jgi:hypothetical protein
MKRNLLLQCSDSFNKSTGRVPQVSHQSVQGTGVLLPMDFFLWALVNDNIYVSPLPTTLHEFKTRIREACANTEQKILHNVWQEVVCGRWSVVCAIALNSHITNIHNNHLTDMCMSNTIQSARSETSFPFPFVPLQRRGCLVAPWFL